MSNLTRSKPKRKRPEGVQVMGKRIVPPKTPAGFPLTPHSCGKYCVFRLGRMRYYGRWFAKRRGEIIVDADGWRAAWDEYRKDEPDLIQGREPQQRDDDTLTIGRLCNSFLLAKTTAVESGELSPRSVVEYRYVTDRLVKHFGPGRAVETIRPEDFAPLRLSIVKQFGPVRQMNTISRTRSVFKWAFDNGLIDRPIRYGSMFDKPSKAIMRKHRAASGPKMFEADELRTILAAAEQPLRAMILLGINCGFGASDLSELPTGAVDLERGWIDFPRPKTGIARRIPLWAETIEALREAVANRAPARKVEYADRVFLTVRGLPLVRAESSTKCDEVAVRFGPLIRKLGLHKPGRGFYALRHTFRTVADETLDQVAAMSIMGHSDASMSGIYRQRISDARLTAVVEHVRTWLFG